MKEGPIIFSTLMVRAIMRKHNPKTQTRRVIKPQPKLARGGESEFDAGDFWHWKDCQWLDGGIGMPESAIEDYAQYQPGDILWVRETWNKMPIIPLKGMKMEQAFDYRYIFAADGDTEQAALAAGLSCDEYFVNRSIGWKPSIHMPRAAARIFLRVTDVRAERVQEISDADCIAEGIQDRRFGVDPLTARDMERLNLSYPKLEYKNLWDYLNSKRDGGIFVWAKKPWVWAYTFERIENLQPATENAGASAAEPALASATS